MHSYRPAADRQRGAFSMLSAATLVMAILFLALVIDSGRLYLEQRNLQKLADTAALESISRLASGNCALDTALAQVYAVENAASYGFVAGAGRALSSSCVSVSIIDGLRVPVADAANGRAVRVVTSSQVPASIVVRSGSLFGLGDNDSVSLQAVAVAEKDSDPLTVFSVGAQLLDLNANGLLPRLLKAAGVNVSGLTLLDSQGLANTQITPGGLLQALGVNVGINQLKALTPEGLATLVDTRVGAVGIQRLVDVSANLAGNNQALAADIRALGATLANSQLNNATVNLLATDERPGLLKLVTGPGQALGSALDARLTLGDLLSTGLMTAVQGRGLLMDQLNLLGLVKVELGIIEPPSIGIGPLGTTAFNAQARLHIDIDSTGTPLASPLLNMLGTSIKLPIILDLASAKGELTAIDCSRAEPEATIEVESTVGNICIGTMPNGSRWSTRASCTESNLQDASILRLLNLDLIRGKAAVPLIATGNNPVRDELTLAEDESDITQVNNLKIGDSITNLLSQVSRMIGVGAPKGADGYPGFTPSQAAQIADRYLATYPNKDAIRAALKADGLTWPRPVALLLDTTMPDEWYGKLPLTTCTTNKAQCRTELISSLQTKPQAGLLSNVLTGLASSLGLSSNSQPLLLTILNPVLDALKPVLNAVGSAVSSLLSNLGLDLGKSEIKVHSISCGIPQLIR
ncbi:pilus assembly protein TadG-related protein [Pseudomonas sp. URMO17WK12:I2]|uniref:pilus assembly protein TadG-related protein n=1 Tax=Pseudomonas sp. URMO17WK12:I2 TaxID=1261623 RepID=UPI000DAC6E13|nr:pilus assembly protein TadG-related protein [Pseudomonas sp. URMO17WK12:I2]